MTKFANAVLPVRKLRFDALVGGPEAEDLVLFLHGFPQFADSWLQIMAPIADAGFRTAAVDQRGYSPAARSKEVDAYAVEHLLADVEGFANSLGAGRFHLVGHDWGALLAWKLAAENPERVKSLTAISTPHPDALFHAMQSDADQMDRSKYVAFFRMPGHLAEAFLRRNDYKNLRDVYQGKLPASQVEENVRRLAEPGALSAALNWYRALRPGTQTGKISVPTLYIWSSKDLALGETAALATAAYVSGPYGFERLEGASHWLLEEMTARVSTLLLQHLETHRSS
jgi:pimeloyl-ACP methyl ester carboxylesterase